MSKSPANQTKISVRPERLGRFLLRIWLRNHKSSWHKKLYFSDEDVAGTMGWTIEDVRQMKRIYVDAKEINSAKIAMLRRNRHEENVRTDANQVANRFSGKR